MCLIVKDVYAVADNQQDIKTATRRFVLVLITCNTCVESLARPFLRIHRPSSYTGGLRLWSLALGPLIL